jgi:glutathione S-transferase
MYKLIVIPGSHACRAAILMLDHKRVPYECVEVVTLTHPIQSRVRGFDAGGQTRSAGSHRPLPLRLGDLFGTVPALAAGDERLSTNHQIARFLDKRHPEPSLFPPDPEQRRAVEEAERWGNEVLQMAARRVTMAWVLREPAAAARRGGDGRTGYLLYRSELLRRLITPQIGRLVFAAGRTPDEELLADLRRMLDRIDRWIEEGVLNGEQLNAADFMIAPSLAIMLYRPDIPPLLEGRPALDLVDRLLPEPGAAAAPAQPRAAVSAD